MFRNLIAVRHVRIHTQSQQSISTPSVNADVTVEVPVIWRGVIVPDLQRFNIHTFINYYGDDTPDHTNADGMKKILDDTEYTQGHVTKVNTTSMRSPNFWENYQKDANLVSTIDENESSYILHTTVGTVGTIETGVSKAVAKYSFIISYDQLISNHLCMKGVKLNTRSFDITSTEFNANPKPVFSYKIVDLKDINIMYFGMSPDATVCSSSLPAGHFIQMPLVYVIY